MEDLMKCLRCDSPAHLSYPHLGGHVVCECSNPSCRLYSQDRFGPERPDPNKPRPQWLWITHHTDCG